MVIRDEVLVAAKEVFLRSYLGEFDRFLPKMMEVSFNKSESANSLSQRSHYRILRRLLHDRSVELRQNLNDSMDRLLQRSLQTAYSAFRPSFALPGAASLSLVEPAAFEGELRLAAFTERFRYEAEDELRDLNVRVALLFGQDEVKEREVPFRPYLVSKSLAEAVDRMRLPPEVSDLMTPLLAECYAGAIDEMYATVNRCLADNGIAADMPLRIKKSPDKSIADERFYAGGNPAGIAEGSVTEFAPAHPDENFRSMDASSSFLANGMNSPAAGLGPEGTLNRLFEMVRRFGGALPDFAVSTGLDDSRQAGGAVRDVEAMCNALSNTIFERRHELCGQSEDTNERMIADIVAMLFEFIMRDSLVPMEIREQLGKLQFLVLKVALYDGSLWLGNEHPLRALINRIASVSAGIGSGEPVNPRFNAKITEMTENLLNDGTEEVELLLPLFERAVAELDGFIEQDIRIGDDKLNRAIQALGDIRARSLNFARLYVQTKGILSKLALESFLHEFLAETWTEAIELADSREPARSDRFRTLMPNLVWSVAPKLDEYDRQTLSALLPAMIGTLREGMMSVAWPQSRQKELLGRLFDAHTGALRSNHAVSPPSLASLHQAFESLVKQAPGKQPVTDQAIDHVEKILICGALRRLDTDINSLQDYPGRATGAAAVPASYGEKSRYPASREPRLSRGCFFEVALDQAAGRARLCWVSSDASIMLFKLDRQTAPLMITLAEFQRLLASGQIRFAEERLLFDRALHSLLSAAEHLARV
ncbi:MAG TPA: DUF1631 family protein [Burkholderiales bacterium]|nr:DUF1631 family protein [Burkholderiales bacterium]